eukprot:jgi/Mesvir1/21534/Mv03975-RA.1
MVHRRDGWVKYRIGLLLRPALVAQSRTWGYTRLDRTASRLFTSSGKAALSRECSTSFIMHWCESREVLGSIFQFSTSQLSDAHATEQVEKLYNLLYQSIQDPGSPLGLWHLSKQDADALYQAAKTTKAEVNPDVWTANCRSSIHDISWFASYGCAMVAVVNVCGGDEMVAPLVVGLDIWSHTVGGLSNEQHSATSHGHSLLHHPAVPKHAWPQVMDLVFEIKSTAQEEASRTDVRTAAADARGHQRTPAFISSLFSDAVKATLAEGRPTTQPQGGFTDVLLEQMQPLPPALAPLPQAARGGGRSQHMPVAAGTPAGSDDARDRDTPRATDSWATPSSKQTGHRVDTDVRGGVKRFAEKLQAARQKLDRLVLSREEMRAAMFRLPDEGSVAAPLLREPMVTLPELTLPTTGNSLDLLGVATQNLGGLPLLPPHATHPLMAVDKEAAKELPLQLAMRGIEQVVFGAAVAARGGDKHGWACPDVVPGDLLPLEEKYRSLLDKFLCLEGLSARMRVEARSREALLVWVVFCFADAHACAEYPILREYGVALQWEDLRHLVLGDRRAVDAALAVGQYLRTRTMRRREVFTLREPCDPGVGPPSSLMAEKEWETATVAMARQMAQEGRLSAQFRALWREEQADADRRVQGHWRERRERATATESDAYDTWSRSGCHDSTRAAYTAAQRQTVEARAAEDACKKDVKAKEAFTPGRVEGAAAAVPDERARVAASGVAQLAFTAQQMLLPYP